MGNCVNEGARVGASRFCRFEVFHSASVLLASKTLALPINNWDALARVGEGVVFGQRLFGYPKDFCRILHSYGRRSLSGKLVQNQTLGG